MCRLALVPGVRVRRMHNAIALAVAAIMVGMSCGSPLVAGVPGQERVRTVAPLSTPADGAGAPGLDWTGLAKVVTLLGGPEGTLVLGAALLGADPPTGEMAINASVSTALVVETLKIGLGRARPYVPGEHGRFTGPSLSGQYHSMPSGHSANAFAMATVLAHRYPEQASLLYGLALVIGLSRIQLGVHWPSDVIAGAAIGLFVGDQVVQGRLHLLELDGMPSR